MSNHASPADIDALLLEAGWARRLARRLTADAADAEDLLQETWLAATEHPPAVDRPLRPWIAVVLRNRFVTRALARRRREARQARHAGDATVESPEQLLEKVQVQRMLAELVAGLDEPYRQTVILRYFEELSGSEIARRMGIPAGTVRWRLKTALDGLKRQLDERHGGDRAAWRALLLPVAGSTDWRPRPMWPLAIGAIGATVGLTLGLLVPTGGPEKTRRGTGALASFTAVTLTTVSPPRFGAPPFDLAACQEELKRLRAERVALEVESRGQRSADELFWLGEPNPVAMDAIRPGIEAAARRLPAAPSYSLECRTWACRLLVVSPAREEPWAGTWSDWTTLGGDLDNRIFGFVMAIGSPSKDALTGEALTEEEIVLPLRDPSGASVDRTPGPGPQVAPALPDGPLPDTPTACASERDRLRAEVLEAREDREINTPLAERFNRTASVDPKLAQELKRHMAAAFPGLYTGNMEVECRENLCRARWPSGPRSWHGEVRGEAWIRKMAERVQGSHEEVYLDLASRPRAYAGDLVRDLVSRFERGTIPDDCASRFPATGSLQVRFDLRRNRARERRGEAPRLTARFGHTLAGTPLGNCLEAAIEREILAAFEPSLTVGDAIVSFHRFDFPRRGTPPARK